MNRTHYITLAYLILSHPSFAHSPSQPHHEPIILQAEILQTLDGNGIGINGKTITLIKKYQANIMNILRGKRNVTGAREGMFTFQGKKHSVAALKELEDLHLIDSHAKQALLKSMRRAFEEISLEFRPIARGAKPIMSLLILESCQARNRNDSLLVIWSNTKEHDEEELFDKHIISVKDFEIFLIDLYNYLTDMCNSCPKAMKQFNDSVERFNKIKSYTTSLKLNKDKESAFLKYATQALEHDHVNPGEITEEKIKELYHTFKTS